MIVVNQVLVWKCLLWSPVLPISSLLSVLYTFRIFFFFKSLCTSNSSVTIHFFSHSIQASNSKFLTLCGFLPIFLQWSPISHFWPLFPVHLPSPHNCLERVPYVLSMSRLLFCGINSSSLLFHSSASCEHSIMLS